MTRRIAAFAVLVAALGCAACGTSRAPRQPAAAAPPRAQGNPGVGHARPSAHGRSPASPPPKAPARARTRHPIVGIGDNKTEFLTDPRFRALGITHVRDDVPWDVLEEPYPRARLALWLREAHREHLTPLISFDHSGLPGRTRMLPSVAQFSRLFMRLRSRYPWLREFVTWDESNYFGEPTATHARRVARYYLALRRDCPSCTILATDLLDLPDRHWAVPMVHWVHEFLRYVPGQPAYWGLNNYVGANAMQTASTRALLHAVSGKIWFAETAGVISDGGHATVATASRLARQAAVDRYILGPLASLSSRIQRVYLYEWNAQTVHDGWDSALISAGGAARPAYFALADVLESWGLHPRCAISTAPPSCTSASSSG